MRSSIAVKRVLSILILTTISSVTAATPIIFNFTGTVTDQILDGGGMLDTWASISKWNGKSISGSFTMNLDDVTPVAQNHEQIFYLTEASNDNSRQWLEFVINNPDGTSYSIPTSTDPLPVVDSNYSAANLVSNENFSILYIAREFQNKSFKNPPLQEIMLRLATFGEGSDQLYSSLDFNTVEFHPELATYQNYGLVNYLKDNGKKMEYFFTIDTLTRIEHNVPESGILGLMLLGLASLVLGRLRGIK